MIFVCTKRTIYDHTSYKSIIMLKVGIRNSDFVKSSVFCLVLSKMWGSDLGLPGWLHISITSGQVVCYQYKKGWCGSIIQRIKGIHQHKEGCGDPTFVYISFFPTWWEVSNWIFSVNFLIFWVPMMLCVVTGGWMTWKDWRGFGPSNKYIKYLRFFGLNSSISAVRNLSKS